MTKTQRRTAIRMIGHLLEHRPTAGKEARSEYGGPVPFHSSNATCWCLTGAANLVSRTLKLDDVAIFNTLANMFAPKHFQGYLSLSDFWDKAYALGQTRPIIQALKDYK